MITSGLVNIRKGKVPGYPQFFSESETTIIRPFVDTIDKGFPKFNIHPETPSIVLPAPVFYNDIFGGRTTADERNYILRQAQNPGLNPQTGYPKIDAPSLPEESTPQQPDTQQPDTQQPNYPDSAIEIENLVTHQDVVQGKGWHSPDDLNDMKSNGTGARTRQ